MGVSAGALVAHRGSFILDVPSFRADVSGTAVLGANGAGKTTLLLALQRLIPSEGTVTAPAPAASVFARPAVLRGTTLWNVSIVATTTLGITTAEAERRAHTALSDVGLESMMRADARTLSTGQRQRLALARALVVEPKALYLDEPFANVDADARPDLRSLVRAYVERMRCDLVLVTSSLADAAALCAKTVVLRDGRIVYEGLVRDAASAQDAYLRALVAETDLHRYDG
jgi:molybdate transport system ATP-binding protein